MDGNGEVNGSAAEERTECENTNTEKHLAKRKKKRQSLVAKVTETISQDVFMLPEISRRESVGEICKAFGFLFISALFLACFFFATTLVADAGGWLSVSAAFAKYDYELRLNESRADENTLGLANDQWDFYAHYTESVETTNLWDNVRPWVGEDKVFAYKLSQLFIAMPTWGLAHYTVLLPVFGFTYVAQSVRKQVDVVFAAVVFPLFMSMAFGILSQSMYFKGDENDRTAWYIIHCMMMAVPAILIVSAFLLARKLPYLDSHSSVRKKRKDATKLAALVAAPSTMSQALAASIFPVLIMPWYAANSTTDFQRGVIALVLPAVLFYVLNFLQRWGIWAFEGKSSHLCPAGAAPTLVLVTTLWRRVLVAGNVERTAIAGTSLLRRLPLLFTSVLASMFSSISRLTSGKRDEMLHRWGDEMTMALLKGSSSAAVHPSPMRRASSWAEPKPLGKRRLSRGPSGVFGNDSIYESLAMLAFLELWLEMALSVYVPALSGYIEVKILDENKTDVFVGNVLNASFQLLAESFFAFLVLWIKSDVEHRTLNRMISTVRFYAPWIALLTVLCFPVGMSFAVEGLTRNLLRG
eukprot:g1089.t1